MEGWFGGSFRLALSVSDSDREADLELGESLKQIGTESHRLGSVEQSCGWETHLW